MQFTNYEETDLRSLPSHHPAAITQICFIFSEESRKQPLRRIPRQVCASRFHLTFITSHTETDWHKLDLKASSDMARELSKGRNAPDRAAPFLSPILHAPWSLLLPGLFIACCSWLELPLRFPLSDQLFRMAHFLIFSLWWLLAQLFTLGPAVPFC